MEPKLNRRQFRHAFYGGPQVPLGYPTVEEVDCSLVADIVAEELQRLQILLDPGEIGLQRFDLNDGMIAIHIPGDVDQKIWNGIGGFQLREELVAPLVDLAIEREFCHARPSAP